MRWSKIIQVELKFYNKSPNKRQERMHRPRRESQVNTEAKTEMMQPEVNDYL